MLGCGREALKGPWWLPQIKGQTFEGGSLAGRARGAPGQHQAGTGPGRKHTQSCSHSSPSTRTQTGDSS